MKNSLKEDIHYLTKKLSVRLDNQKDKELVHHIASIIDRLQSENTLLFKRLNELDDKVHDVLVSRENRDQEIQGSSK